MVWSILLWMSEDKVFSDRKIILLNWSMRCSNSYFAIGEFKCVGFESMGQPTVFIIRQCVETVMSWNCCKMSVHALSQAIVTLTLVDWNCDWIPVIISLYINFLDLISANNLNFVRKVVPRKFLIMSNSSVSDFSTYVSILDSFVVSILYSPVARLCLSEGRINLLQLLHLTASYDHCFYH